MSSFSLILERGPSGSKLVVVVMSKNFDDFAGKSTGIVFAIFCTFSSFFLLLVVGLGVWLMLRTSPPRRTCQYNSSPISSSWLVLRGSLPGSQ